MRALIAAVALLLGSPQVQGKCPLRFVEPRLQDLEAAATKLAPDALMPALAARDASVRDLALVARWFSIRANGDAEQHMRATLELLEIWDQHRPAGRLLRREREELAAQGWPMPSAAEIDRTLSRLGDRSAVLERTRALLAAPSPSLDAVLRRAAPTIPTVVLLHHAASRLKLRAFPTNDEDAREELRRLLLHPGFPGLNRAAQRRQPQKRRRAPRPPTIVRPVHVRLRTSARARRAGGSIDD